MVIQCTAVIVLITLLSSTFGSYWGDIPETREVVQLSADTWEASSLEVKLHSQSLGRLILDTRLNREAVIGGAKKHAVTHNTRIQDELNTGCHYRGTVRDKPQYLVMLSTCSGRIRGSLTDVNSTWYVVYDKESYVMFSDSDLPNPYGIATGEYNGVELNHSISRPVSYHPLYKRGLSTDPIIATHKTVEVVVVTDRSFWQQFDTKIEEVEEFVLATVAKIDEIYKKYGVRIALVGMENWRVADMITVTPSYSATLRNFTMYRQEKLLNVYKQHDVSILMTAVDFDGAVIGYAGVDTMCRSSCASVNFNSRKSVDFYASVIAHEMGHNFGMYHDSEECVCPPEISWDCLMSDSMGKASSIFSNCSQLVLNSFTGTCLNNQPKTLYGDPVCGNGFVEEGEECDCGTEEECIASDPCCEPIGCKLKPGAKCYSGDCCEECQFVSYKRMCRPASSECDLVEFCTGTNSQCPTNRYTQDGTLCGEGSGFCNYGSCQTLGTQCTSLWGEGVAVSDSACYDRFNRKGEWYGNCGSLGDRKFLACMDRDVFCGKLYCEVAEGRTTNLRHVYRSDLHYNSTYECTLAAGPRSIESQDVAMVYDGTKCGDSKWCIAGQCVEFEKVACPSPGGVECGGQGNCNDLNQCHCNAGYDPEFNCSVLLQVAGWDLKTILIAVMIIVLVVIPSCIITLLLCRRYNPKVKEFFDHHTQIRFSIHLPSISRRPSYLRRSSKRSNPDSSKTANGKTTAKEGDQPASYVPLNMHPVRPAPPRPGGISTAPRPSSQSYDSPISKRDLHTFGPPSRSVPTVHRGPKALQATTRDNVKMDISGPGSARKLLDDKPLNERELAGSPLRDLLAKR